MQYTAKFGIINNPGEGQNLKVIEYQYDDIPFSIQKLYKNLVESLTGVQQHYLYNANDKQIIDINNKIVIRLKEFMEGFNGSSGFITVALKDVANARLSMRIPRDTFELYTLVSLVQNLIDSPSLQQNVNLLNNGYTIYNTDDYDFSKIAVFMRGVVFDITKNDKSFICKARIDGIDISTSFDDLADYKTVVRTLYKKIIDEDILNTELLAMFNSIVLDLKKSKSLSTYTYKNNKKEVILEISYVGPMNVNIKLFKSISYTTTLDKCTSSLKALLQTVTSDLNHLNNIVK